MTPDPSRHEVRDFAADDRRSVRRLRFRIFSADEFTSDEDEFYVADDRRVVAEQDGRLVGHAAAWQFGQFFGGREVPMAGIAAVVVESHARGDGIASAMLARLVERVLVAGDVIATLYPATVRPYRKLGWEYAGLRPSHVVPTRSLAQVASPDDGEVRTRPGTPDDAAAMRGLYLQVAQQHDGWLALDPRYIAYNAGELHDRGPDEWWVAHRGDEVTGYVLYSRVEAGSGLGRHLVVRELVAADAATERTLWRLVGSSWTIWPTTVVRGPVEPSVAALLSEEDLHPGPAQAGQVRWSRWMTRVLDLPGAVAARGFPGVADATVELHVDDPWLGRNDGDWVLQVSGGEGHIERGGAGTVRTDVGALSALYAGYTPAATWRRLGRLRADEAAVRTLDGLFRGPMPTSLHYF